MAQQSVIAVDLGAESGRVMAAAFDGRSLALQELHRFPNTPVTVRGTLHWDLLRLWHEIQHGLAKGKERLPASLGVDTWGVDFALLDEQGALLGNPVHYRDQRTAGMMQAVFSRVPRQELFARTGIQFLPINTLYQLMSLVESRSPQVQAAATFLTVPDLLNYWLSGARVCEYTNATTTQMLDARNRDWASELLQRLDIPTHILPDIVAPGTRLGAYEGIPVIAPACHDTGSAVAAVPAQGADFAYISSGTWSLVGLELDEPLLDERALAANVTNEGGVFGSYRLLKNLAGLWILQQCRAAWAAAGQSYTYPQLVEMAAQAEPLAALFDPNDAAFLSPGDHPQQIRARCRDANGPPPETPGAVVRAVLESLALAYRQVLEQVAAIAGRQISAIHIVGGGSQNALLNQMTANATGLPVVAGPVEATVIGNALVQLIALGELAGRSEARALVAGMGQLQRYEPQQSARWEEAYHRFQALQAQTQAYG